MATSASAQLARSSASDRPAPRQRRSLQGIDALRADFVAKIGQRHGLFRPRQRGPGRAGEGDARSAGAWLRQHPEVVVRIEGHGDTGDTRDHALAIGARRAEEVRDYLVLLGVPAAQLSARAGARSAPASPRAVTVLVR